MKQESHREIRWDFGILGIKPEKTPIAKLTLRNVADIINL